MPDRGLTGRFEATIPNQLRESPMSFAISRAVVSVVALELIEERARRAEREHATRRPRRSRKVARALHLIR